MNHPEVTAAALSILRNPATFQWYVIPLLAIVIYIYANEIQNRRWNVVAAGLALYGVHWLVEIINALIQHFTGHALWTVPTGTTFLLLIGVGVEISLMFSIAGLALSKLLPPDPKTKILGVNNRLLFTIGWATFFAVFEIFLVQTPTFVWVYPWWGALPVFVFVYIPFFAAAFYVHDWPRRRQIQFIGILGAVDVFLLIILVSILRWI
jgi:hypothetical protein